MDCLGALAAVYPLGAAPGLGEFRARLHAPLRDLLPPEADRRGLGDLILLGADGQLADAAWDLALEHYLPSVALEQHWPWERVRAEQEEQRLFGELRRLSAAEYARARRLLIDHPAGQLGALRRAWDQLWPTLGNYGPIAPSSQLEGWWFPCPMCHWPMRIEQSGAVRRIRCEAHGRDGVVYTTAPQRWKGGRPLLERSGRNAPHVLEQPASRDHLAVSRAVWRYVTLPGVLERELADYAQRCGATVDMYRDHDAYDLHIEIGPRIWRLDAKDWASPIKLIESLRHRDEAGDAPTIVIPDSQRRDLDLLKQVLRKLRVRTAGQVRRELRVAARGKR
jgi:hypothetical protein